MTWLHVLAAALGITLAILWIIIGLSAIGFDRHVDWLRRRLRESQMWPQSGSSMLPEIVRNYAVNAGGRIGAGDLVHCRQRASLSIARDRPPIMIDADQWTGAVQPGIVWSARGRMNGLPVRIVDALVDGRGELVARLLGFIKVAGGKGPDYDKGELMRYLSELPVHPDAILNIASLRWRMVNERTAEVMARSATGPAIIRFIFNEAGEIARMEADDRPRSTNGICVPTPWHGTYSDYRQFGRYRLPARGEVGWVLPDGLFTYWRGEIVAYDAMPEGRTT